MYLKSAGVIFKLECQVLPQRVVLTVPEQISSLLPVAPFLTTEHKVVKVTAVISRNSPRTSIAGPSFRASLPSARAQLYS